MKDLGDGQKEAAFGLQSAVEEMKNRFQEVIARLRSMIEITSNAFRMLNLMCYQQKNPRRVHVMSLIVL